MSSDKVWLVTSGEYSDYSVNYAFATEALAKAFIEREGADEGEYGAFRIEEYELHATLPGRIRTYRASATLTPDGQLIDVRVHGEMDDASDWVTERAALPDDASDIASVFSYRDGRTAMSVSYRRGPEVAEKALQDLAARVKAERAGVV